MYTTSAGKKDMPTRVPMSDVPSQTVESAPTWRVELALRSDAMVAVIRSIKLCVARSLDEHRTTQPDTAAAAAAATTQPAGAAVASLQVSLSIPPPSSLDSAARDRCPPCVVCAGMRGTTPQRPAPSPLLCAAAPVSTKRHEERPEAATHA